MKYADKIILAAGAAGLLSACGSFDGVDDSMGGIDTGAASRPASAGVSDLPVKIGEPYKIGNKTYTPADSVDYDEVGYASFYGEELAGRPTANGEIFNPSGVTAAHKTLPLPSYVEVTALSTGKTILVRINDRGPFVDDRLIDLSSGAARQLGITADGVAGVRVRKVNPPDQEKSVLRQGRPAIERIETPDSLLVVLREKLAKMPKPAARASAPMAVAADTATPTAGARSGRFIREGAAPRPATEAISRRPAGAPAPIAATPRKAAPQRGSDGFIREGSGAVVRSGNPGAASGYVVQLASFGSKSRADALARKLGANVQTSPDGKLFRVRYGPYSKASEAERGLATARQRGYHKARIFRQ